MQFLLIALLFLGTYLLPRDNRDSSRVYHRPPSEARYIVVVLVVSFLVTMGLLLFSDQFSILTEPLFGGMQIGVIRWSTAILCVFVADIACTACLVFLSSGSYQSPFTPVFFILPGLAFFLREPPQRVLIYTFAIAILFVIELRFCEEGPTSPERAFGVVSVGCLLLSGCIGYLTRPH